LDREAGFLSSPGSPVEPWNHDIAWSVKYLIQDEINGDPNLNNPARGPVTVAVLRPVFLDLRRWDAPGVQRDLDVRQHQRGPSAPLWQRPLQQAAKVVAGGGEHGVDGVAAGMGKVIAAPWLRLLLLRILIALNLPAQLKSV